MFIISNYNKKVPFKITKKNNLNSIESQKGNVKYISTETNSPVNYFCYKEDSTEKKVATKTAEDGTTQNNRIFSRDSLIPSKLFIVQTIYEKQGIEAPETREAYLNLINDFGDKRSKNLIKRRDIVSYVSKQSITFNIENQILPAYDKEAANPRDAFALEYLLKDTTYLKLLETVEFLGEQDDILASHLSDFTRTLFCETLQGDQDKKVLVVALDCFYKILNEIIIQEKTFGFFKFFYDEVKDKLVRGRLPRIDKDKTLVKFYIVLLIAMDMEVKIKELPRFGETLPKICSLLKIVGCNIGKNGIARLEAPPKDTFEVKKIKSG